MSNETKWNMIGREELVGREAVIGHCNKSTKLLETVSTTMAKPKIYRMEACVVLEGAAQFQDRQNQISGVASCDVFQFSDGKLVKITSYVIDLDKP
jgi:hypothetical protein